ncbi:hypothetical protein [Acetobacter okinawensis]|uniref:hypothetical protein n=1 Tax=Acetobacter okinawensis TaxID=1076594 RepID=UPI0011DDF787|nr:hypothetical protein [Acetobacter okinawensis]
MDIFLSPGDSPLTITAGDTTLHIRVSPNMDTSPQPPRRHRHRHRHCLSCGTSLLRGKASVPPAHAGDGPP